MMKKKRVANRSVVLSSAMIKNDQVVDDHAYQYYEEVPHAFRLALPFNAHIYIFFSWDNVFKVIYFTITVFYNFQFTICNNSTRATPVLL